MVGALEDRDEGGSCQLASPPGEARDAPVGDRVNQGDRDDQVPAIRVKRLSARDDTVANKRRKNSNQGRGSKRPHGQQLDAGQKRICFHSSQTLGIGVEPSHQIPVLQLQETTAPSHSAGQLDASNTQQVDPVQPLLAGLGQDVSPLTPGLAGQHQGVASGSRSAPSEPNGGARSSAL